MPLYIERISDYMYVTNLMDYPLGLDGRIILAPKEVDRWISDDNKGLCQRARVLEKNSMVSIKAEVGLDKTGGTTKAKAKEEPVKETEVAVEPATEPVVEPTAEPKQEVGEVSAPKKPAAKPAAKASK